MKRTKLKERIARLLLAALILSIGRESTYAAALAIDTGDVDLTILVDVSPVLNSANMVKWRTGVANQTPQLVTPPQLTFDYISKTKAAGKRLAIPSRANCGDNSCNDQGDLWSDNAIAVD